MANNANVESDLYDIQSARACGRLYGLLNFPDAATAWRDYNRRLARGTSRRTVLADLRALVKKKHG